MNTHDGNTPHSTTLAEYLRLQEKLHSLGWHLGYHLKGEKKVAHYGLVKFNASTHRSECIMKLSFDKFDLVCAMAALLKAGIEEKVILGALDKCPTLDAYVTISNRLDRHHCWLRGTMDFDRMTIGYVIKIRKQVLLFNEWESVVEFANYLDLGAPHKALIPPTAANQDAKERNAV